MSIDYREHKKYKNGVFKTKAEIEAELKAQGIDKIYYVLSFGGGTQSSHLLDDHFKGKIHYDYIIFSDTGAEPSFIHKQVEWWKQRQKKVKNKTPFIITNHSSMHRGLEEMLFRYIHTDYQRFQLPVHCSTKDEKGNIKAAGMMARQCTIDFKIIPVKQKIRQLILKEHGLNPKQMVPKNIAVIIDIGFSVDEISRVNTYRSPQFKYMYLAYPLIESNLTTKDSIEYLENNNYPKKRSRCYLCPFNCNKRDIGMDWAEIIEEEPLSFLKAAWIDNKLREVQATGTKIMHSIPYLHFSRIPLSDVYKGEYNYLLSVYGLELEIWLNEWTNYIKRKYLSRMDSVAA